MPAKIANTRNVTLITKNAFMMCFALGLEEITKNCVMNESTALYRTVLKNHLRV